MLVQCTYGPVTTEVMGTSYTFEVDEYGRFVAEVWNTKHLDALCSVVWYRVVPKEPVPLALDEIVPDTAPLNSGDVTLHCIGTGFAPDSMIVFAGQLENTVFVSDTELTTIVKTELSWGEVSLPVAVRNYASEVTDPLDFTFTAAAAADAPADGEPAIPVTDITGVGPTTATKLAGEGITTANQIAAMTDEELAALDDTLGLGGRTARDGWIAQAKALIG
jgi:predicted flap endonuclease-1-like 5' DNA nuclease